MREPVFGTFRRDLIFTFDGSDDQPPNVIFGLTGRDQITFSSPGNDLSFGGQGRDSFRDVVPGTGTGDDIAFGGLGQDFYTYNDGNDIFVGGVGFDSFNSPNTRFVDLDEGLFRDVLTSEDGDEVVLWGVETISVLFVDDF